MLYDLCYDLFCCEFVLVPNLGMVSKLGFVKVL